VGGASAVSSVNLHKYFGKVPKYIEKYKEMKELDRLRQDKELNDPSKDIPSGMKLLSEEERVKLIQDLEDTKWEICRKINSLPIS
jgi:hypothetical protein